ncbi:elongation factor P hydroxylase [Neiella marina]|uniref:Elongation factor P hydroxylase n=1 Tax=Neiella holothuriorum TaxID=2870530 RepID=A0ABS7EDK0_9GAMM|nr:elongation factor P hydroxylase [Neiella holothuriorum]MBW8190414.1 elongation factor P hydroxylase [Neiella holothuriorum]
MASTDTEQTAPLIALFNQTFACLNTILVKGDGEPLYLPAAGEMPAQVIFAHGYFASAMHELAHWCLAGETRRQLEDYGYWYCPDGRDADQQAAFENVEIKPQAIEWAFMCAAGRPFRVSSDNLNGAQSDRLGFQHRVHAQALRYLTDGFPPRAQQWLDALQQHYQTAPLQHADFDYRGMYEC